MASTAETHSVDWWPKEMLGRALTKLVPLLGLVMAVSAPIGDPPGPLNETGRASSTMTVPRSQALSVSRSQALSAGAEPRRAPLKTQTTASTGNRDRGWRRLSQPQVTSNELAVHVDKNKLVGSNQEPVRLIGVDRSGTEYACVQGWGIFDGPSNARSVAAMAAWRIDAVRVPLNEDCWLGINGVPSRFSGLAYQAAIKAYVARLNNAGLVAVLDLHWSAPGKLLSTGQEPMPDADHSVAFWTSVAKTFRTQPGVLFDLFNEPHGVSWDCWLSGCRMQQGWQAAGMQQLVDAVRDTGAPQPIMLEGLNWGGDLSGWLAHEPKDPLNQLIASVHIYNYSACANVGCWNTELAPVSKVVPIVTGEVGQRTCGSSFIRAYMTWADAHGISYIAWTWDTWDRSCGDVLIRSFRGTPTVLGAAFKSHISSLSNRVTATTCVSGCSALSSYTPHRGTAKRQSS